jgi:D-inositol-3-phosphate glycosyltransferase
MDERMNFSKNHNIALICFSSSFGGLELTTLQLAREFNNRMADCTLIIPPKTPLAREAAKYDLRVDYLKPRMKYGDLLASRLLAHLLKYHDTEIAVVMQSRDISIVAASKLMYSPPKLVFYQQMQSKIDKRDVLHTWMYSKLSLWISLTKRMKQEVLDHTRVPEERITVVPLGRDTHVFDPGLYNQRRARRKYNLPLERPIVGVLGRLDPQKGQEEFLRSLPLVLERQRDVYYVIAGDETRGEEGYRKHLINVSNELGIADSVRILPFTENVPEFMAALDVFAMPSYSETFGLVLIEAMAMEKPVVATSTGGVPEIVKDHQDGLLIPPRDERALADAVLLLLQDSALRISLSKHARLDALEHFEASHCVDQLVVSLDSL